MTWLNTTHYLAKAEEAEKSDNPEVANLGESLKWAIWQNIELQQRLAARDRLLDLAPDQPQVLLEKLKQHYKEPVMPVSEYCKAFYDWVAALHVAYKEWDETPEEDRSWRSPPPLYEIREHLDMAMHLGVGKSSYLARRIYGGEKHRTRKCPVHKGHWSGLPFKTPLCGCDLTGWLPEPEIEAPVERD